jgi:gliding motility-associated-like protein
LPNPTHKYAAPGNYIVKLSVVTNVGCISDIGQRTVSVALPPDAKFGISNLLCEGGAVVFSDSSSVLPPAAIGTWTWNLANGGVINAATNANQSTTYATAGEYTASLVVTTTGGCASRPFTKTFTINPRPVANFNMPAAVCLPYQQAQFTDASTIADGSEAGFAWQWTFGEPESGARDTALIKNPQHLYSSTGPFSVRLSVTSNNGCTDDTVRLFRNVFPKPVSSFTANPENCFNTATAFTSTANGQGSAIANWWWNTGDGTAPRTGQSISYTYTVADTFIVRHWIVTDNGCHSDTAAAPVIIHPLPVANFNFSTPLCRGTNVTLTPAATVATGSIATYRWNFDQYRPDSLVNNGNAFTKMFDSVRTYNVSLSVTSNKGCVNATPITRALSINHLPRPGFISPEVCLSDASAIFTDTTRIDAGSIVSWFWNFGNPLAAPGTATSTLQNPTHRYSAIGSYTALLITTSNTGCVDSVRQTFTVNGDRPVAGFRVQNPPGYCAYDSVVIKDTSTVNFGNITKVEIVWDNASAPAVVETDDLPLPGKIYKHKYPEFQTPLTKTVSVRYLAYSGANCVDDEIRTVTLHAVPQTQFVNIPPVCLDAASYTISEASEIGGVPGTGVFSGNGVSAAGIFTPSITGAGSFPIRYVYTSAFGCRDTADNTITVLAPATAKFGASAVRCETEAITFTDSSAIPPASGTLTQWRWNFGDGSAPVLNSNSNAVLHTYAAAGNYTVTLSLTTSNGCLVNTQVPVVVSPVPVPAFTFPASVCMPEGIVQFTDASTIADGSTNAFTYNWNFGDPGAANNTATAKNPAHQYTVVRSYNVSLEVTSGARCKKAITLPVNILHPQPVAAFTSDSVSVCQNEAVQFIDNSTGADGVVTAWDWSFGNGTSSSLQVPALQRYATAGSYNIVLRIQNSFGCKDTAQRQFTVYAFPVVSAGPDRVLLQGGELTLEAVVTGSNLQYTWLPNRYLSNNRIQRPVVSGLVEDEITYTLSVTAAGGCKASDDVKVTLLKAPVIPNTFTPNGDGINENWTILYLESYPNCRIQVFDRAGQRVYEKTGYTAPGWDGTLKGKALPFGTYYYVIEPGSGRKPITGYVTLLK